jgi:16S rRNA (uracil1498-N3)-methyltransferase
LRPGTECRLPPAQSRHVARVLRLGEGDALTLFNGDGAEFDAVVARVKKDEVTVKIGGARPGDRESALQVILGQALSTGERMDYTVQKAVELGVSVIQPLQTSRGVVRLDRTRAEKRCMHWQAIAVAACEQCGRNRIPQILPVMALRHWLGRRPAGRDELQVLLSPRAGVAFKALPRPRGGVTLIAGAEAGLTAEEQRDAERGGFVAARLGPRVLRTETAALAALAAMQTLWGDF